MYDNLEIGYVYGNVIFCVKGLRVPVSAAKGTAPSVHFILRVCWLEMGVQPRVTLQTLYGLHSILKVP